MKGKQDNDVIDRKSVISIEYIIEVSTQIEQCVVYDKDKTGQ